MPEIDVAAIMEANGLSFSCHEVEANPYMPQDSSDMRHWLCYVSGGPIEGFEFYLSLGEDAGLPDARVALSLVLEDVRSYRECRGYADFARLIGIDEDDPAGRVAWEEIARLAPLAEAFAALSAAPADALPRVP